MTENSQTENVFSYLRSVWGRGQKRHLIAGALAFVRWMIPLFLAGMAIDWLTRMPAPGRVAILAILLVVSLYQAWRQGWRHLRSFDATRTALRVEDHHGELESVLVSAVQFQESSALGGTSAPMRELTLHKAEEAVAPLPPGEVVSFGGLRKGLVVALLLALLIGAFAVLNGPFLAAGIARIFPPWSSVAYPTRTQMEVEGGDMVVQEGAPALVRAQLSGVIPKRAKVALRTGTGKPRVHELEITGGTCEYPIDSAYRSFEYRISAGDARSEWHTVEVIASPRVERAQVSLEYPAYTERETEVVEALTVTVPEETRIHWELTLDRAVSEAHYTPAGGDPQELEISEDGYTVTMGEVAQDSRSYAFSWVEKDHGFSFTSPNHYLQVAPDQPPRVELTSPKNNLYATLGRQVDLALRARDDHGIGESTVAYRVNKIEEVRVPFEASEKGEGGEQPIDWDYRTALPDLMEGDSVSFVVEVADRYPGAEGPHTARSQARRITFLSVEDYLAQIAKQRLRLLTQLRTIYREERAVHATVSDLDPSGDVFVQTCQLEAVRQDLLRERLGVLRGQMDDLLADLAANNITDEEETSTLTRLSAELDAVADEHVARAATSLRDLAGSSRGGSNAGDADPAEAVQMVDNAARELALMVLQVGFNEATEVMARELHAIAESQARIRLESMLPQDDAGALADRQDDLTQWITRLFASTPQDRESTIEDALVAFNLSRLIKELRSAEVETKMAGFVGGIRKGEPTGTVSLQAEVIEDLLAAEFRLRVGAEREALVKAKELFESEVTELDGLRSELASLDPEQFTGGQAGFAAAQSKLQKKLHLLLMPAIPAARPRLFDANLPSAPDVGTHLAAAEAALENALTHIEAGDRDKAVAEQEIAGASFRTLTGIIDDRVDVLTERSRVASLGGICLKHGTAIGQFVERQLILLEMAEDAEDDAEELAHVAGLEQKLAEDVERFRSGAAEESSGDEILPLLSKLESTVRAMTNSVPSLGENKLDDAVEDQELALEALEEAALLLEKQSAELGALASTLESAHLALTPAPFVADIQDEQEDLVEAAPEAKEEDLPRLAIVQKNLIHAVDAILEALDPLSHQIESGTVFLFAKEDMDAAAFALEVNDMEEAADAGSFVAESLQDLLIELDEVTPQYTYVLEVTEFFHQIVSDGLIIAAAQGQLREKVQGAEDDAEKAGWVEEQRALAARAKDFSDLLERAIGHDRFQVAALTMAEAVEELEAGNHGDAADLMEDAEYTLADDTDELGVLMEAFAYILEPMLVQPDPQVLFTVEVLALASQQKALYRDTQLAAPDQLAELAERQQEFTARCEGFVPRADSHPKLIAAAGHLAEAASRMGAPDQARAIASQREAGDALRHFVIEYVQEHVAPPRPPPPQPSPPTDPTESLGDDFTLFMPGAVSGEKPKGGRQEWEVLGQRDRAALNENFARELPLEYRGILKDYYERLAQ